MALSKFALPKDVSVWNSFTTIDFIVSSGSSIDSISLIGNSKTSVDIAGEYSTEPDAKAYVAASVTFQYFPNKSPGERRKRSVDQTAFDGVGEYFINYIVGDGFCPVGSLLCQNGPLRPDTEYWYVCIYFVIFWSLYLYELNLLGHITIFFQHARMTPK